MPRKARIDAPGALHHIIGRGIERRDIFLDDKDRDNFLVRLGNILLATETPCFAWALMSNHFHLLLRTGNVPISTIMRRLLTGYAVTFNHRYRRSGHLFQNRYKSILCQEDAYLLELVRYIHLNPFRGNIIMAIDALDKYPYSGHSRLMGYHKSPWQNINAVLSYFGAKINTARMKYKQFLEKGIALGKQPDLTGGGLVRSTGGWHILKSMRRMRVHLKGDERILGDSDFVQSVLKRADERMEKQYRLKTKGYDFDNAVDKVAELLNIKSEDLLVPSKQPHRVKARSLICFWAVKELGISSNVVAAKLGIAQSSVTRAAIRGEQIALEYDLQLENENKS
jgi:putative transposase